jgi:fibronectin-binding autotransporter adhesin
VATRTIANGGGNYNVIGTWVEGVVPLSTDAVVATATSGNLTITAGAAANTVNLTNYVGTLTINSGQTWTISGGVTLVAGMTTAGTGTLALGTVGTYTSASSLNISWNVNFSASVVYTISGTWQINGLTTLAGATGTFTGGNINLGGSVTMTGNPTGTCTFTFNGTGTWTGSSTAARRMANLTINTAGTLTMAATGMQFATTTTYTAGTIVYTGSTCFIGASATINGAFPAPANITVIATSTLTLDNAFSWSGTLSGGNFTLTMAGGQTMTGGNIAATAATFTIAMGATGAWSGSGTCTVNAGAALTFTGAQNVTWNQLICQVGTTLTFTASQVLTSTLAPIINGDSYQTTTVKSGTASTSFTLAVPVSTQSDYITYTDVIAGSNTIYNYQGGTLTRTTNIVNFLSPAFERSFGAAG